MTNDQPPLRPRIDRPLYGSDPVQAVSRFFLNYTAFDGRASRSEYWWMQLVFLVVVVVGIVTTGIGGAATASSSSAESIPVGAIPGIVLLLLVGAGTVIPSIALGVRRLHDANLSGLLYLLILMPYLGGLILLILAILPSNTAGARFDASYIVSPTH